MPTKAQYSTLCDHVMTNDSLLNARIANRAAILTPRPSGNRLHKTPHDRQRNRLVGMEQHVKRVKRQCAHDSTHQPHNNCAVGRRRVLPKQPRGSEEEDNNHKRKQRRADPAVA